MGHPAITNNNPSMSTRSLIVMYTGITHLNIKNLADGPGETTLRSIRCALHEDNKRVALDGLWEIRRVSHLIYIQLSYSHGKRTPSMSFLASAERNRLWARIVVDRAI